MLFAWDAGMFVVGLLFVVLWHSVIATSYGFVFYGVVVGLVFVAGWLRF